MTIFWVLVIVFIVPIIACIVYGAIKLYDWTVPILLICMFSILAITFMIIAIAQPIFLKSEALRQEKEKQQIVYQIENLTEDSDKIKLNERILTYNDWINDVNTSKEVYGWFSWYRDFDMTKHTIIDLV